MSNTMLFYNFLHHLFGLVKIVDWAAWELWEIVLCVFVWFGDYLELLDIKLLLGIFFALSVFQDFLV